MGMSTPAFRSLVLPLLCGLCKRPPSETQCALLSVLWEQLATEKRGGALAGNASAGSELLVRSSPPQECDWVTGANGFPPFQSSPGGIF